VSELYDRSARAHVLVCEEAFGSALVFPVVSPDLASYDREEAALIEQAAFLREYLARSPPEAIARLALPEDAALREIRVLLPRDDLPRRLQSDVPVSFACVVVPAGKDAWVMVPALDHTLYVPKGEPIEEAIRAEVRRLVGAEGLSPWQQAGLLPARGYRLEALTIPLPDARRGEGGSQLRQAIAERARQRKAVAALAAASTPLHLAVRADPEPALVGREASASLLASLLDGQDRLGVLITGPELAGKSALVRAFAARSTRFVYATSGAKLIAGMSGLGQWQERVRQVMEAIEALDAVLYFEDLEDLLAERVDEGGADLAGAIRPYIEEGRVRVVAELRSDRKGALEGRHWALFASLGRVNVEPLSASETLAALERRVAHDARSATSKPAVAREALPTLIDLAERYLPYSALPGKALRIYEDLTAVSEKAGSSGGAPAVITRARLHDLFSLTTGVPEILLRDDRALRVEDVAATLRRQIIGQEPAIRALSETVGVVKAGLQPSGKPLATLLFVGPTGVGKTELARALAELLFGSPDRLSRFDMSEFMTADGAERLIRGTDRDGGLLTQRAREQPFCVLLLDEIEKAHPSVFDLLLQVCGEGRLTDARGRTAYFHNAILIMTSNLGAAERRAQAGFGAFEQAGRDDAAHYARLVNASFRPEFVNRLDRIVPFRALTRVEIESVARLTIDRVRGRRGLAGAGVALEVTPGALARLAADGFSEAYGARSLRRHVDEHLVAKLARLLARGLDGGGGEAKELLAVVSAIEEPEPRREGQPAASAEAGGLRFELYRRGRGRGLCPASQQVHDGGEIARLRREAEAMMRLAPIEQLADQIDFLGAQLTLGSGTKDGRPRSSEVAELSAEHYRLREIHGRLLAAVEELGSAEELSIMALFEGQDVQPFLPDAEAAHAAFRRALPRALVATEPRRDGVTLIVEELDDGAFDGFLDALLRALPDRGWTVTAHIDGGERRAREAWPEGRRWGPPRSASALLEALMAPKRTFRSVLLRVEGPYAGAFLALEAGLHRIISPRRDPRGDPGEDDRVHVYLHLVALDATVTEEQWGRPSLAPPHAGGAGSRRRGGAAREHDRVARIVQIAGRRRKLAIDPAAYWARQEDVALEHLLLFEIEGSGLDRGDYFTPPAEDGRA
jgi:ATP-dependent Clp protease ATP-binding subunit ClpC